MIQRFFQEEEGQTLVEYGLLISLIALNGVIVAETRRYLWSNNLDEAAPPATELAGV